MYDDRRLLLSEAGLLLLLLVGIMLCPPIGVLDVYVQALFFDVPDRTWVVPPGDRGVIYLILYRGIKAVLVAAGIVCIAWLAVRLWKQGRSDLTVRAGTAILVAAALPLLIGFLKENTGISCPAQEQMFGGPLAHVDLWARLYASLPVLEQMHCWPAGHASGGFSLMAVRLLPRHDDVKLLWPGLFLGWVLGLYQMARGQHYLSHTIVTMLMAMLLVVMARLWLADRRRKLAAY